ncbi:VOC family protein [Chitinophaga horti]|uniref:VOC family protein n=1 Tax=Chitinophaga horti TaxID=2920382 RepID=A0ABY6IXC6_9BACT|nr:VOC family protein [Chitinophaga horti]UYQ92031.1 VOC family protein [Chitinophaga horti]
MEAPKNAISWFEIPVNDFSRAKRFYTTILNCEMQEMEMGSDRLALFPYDAERGIGGAIVQGPDYLPSQRGSLVYLNAGADLSDVLNRVPAAGGKIELDKKLISEQADMGYYAVFQDTEGNRVALHSMG